ncbi:MmgE/PrpD family protein [uncultured Aeromicrobium sp.]|uniref:MmgE/PrpD family protein n=1 Tax=uncultured Aeromicrobium sp. TaxID=337820 RepID=UPI0025E0EFEC|nr:MmgE/PrpD family protein [uncultured Aeromicrobium sp.]
MTAAETLAQRLAGWAHGLSYEDLGEDLVLAVKQRVLDVVGIAIAAQALPTSAAVVRVVEQTGGRPQATAFGITDRVPAAQAAFVNGVLAHSLDYDDTHLPSVLHPSASVVPAVLAAAEAGEHDGREVIRAVAIGLEVCVRLGMAGYDEDVQNSLFFEHGQHATSICGAMGASAAVAALRGDAATIVHALGIAASMASGIIESNRTGGTVKRLHCGWAAHGAVTAVDLALAGLTGPSTVLEGRFGFFRAWLHDGGDLSQIVDRLGEHWNVPDIFVKPYPANHFTHTAIDAAARLRRAGITPEDVVSLTLGVPAPTVRTIGEPIEVKRAPETGYMAQFSGPYAVAVGLLGGGGLEVGLDDFTDELARDPQRRAIMAKVSVEADDECTAIFPHQFPAVLTAHLADGRTVVEKVLVNRGGNRNPLTFDELATKFRDNAGRRLAPSQVRDLEEAFRHLERQPSLASALRPLAMSGAGHPH